MSKSHAGTLRDMVEWRERRIAEDGPGHHLNAIRREELGALRFALRVMAIHTECEWDWGAD